MSQSAYIFGEGGYCTQDFTTFVNAESFGVVPVIFVSELPD